MLEIGPDAETFRRKGRSDLPSPAALAHKRRRRFDKERTQHRGALCFDEALS